MIRKLVFAAVLGIPLLCITASAQSVDDIVNKSIDARGGLDKLKAITTISMTGTATIGPGIQAPVTVKQKRPSAVRMEFTIQGKALVQATDGKSPWMINPFEGSSDPQTMPADDAKDLDEQADIDGPLVDYKAKGNTVELVGKEDLEGSQVYKLKLTRKSGDVEYLYLDAGTYLEVKETNKRMQQGQEITIDTFMSNYKPVAGVLFPYSIEAKQGGTTQFQVTIDTVEVNKPVEDSIFKMPSK
jgi:outer membrane lipoprotein-sorting protein